MSTTPAGPPAPDPTGGSKMTGSRRAALLGGAITVAIVAVVLVAHAVKGSPTAAAMTTTSAMAMTATTPITPMGANTVMVVRGATLPMMQTSGAAPMAMAMVPLGHANWDGMLIQARTSAPATFVLFNGTNQQLVHPTAKDSFHLMVTLSDALTGYAIPYSSVWATITKQNKIVFDERLWPMISRYMGPHYGNNVDLPSGGTYHLSLLVSPPVAARHLEYKDLWLKPHKVQLVFRWVPKT
jgi:Fe2+ transport protein